MANLESRVAMLEALISAPSVRTVLVVPFDSHDADIQLISVAGVLHQRHEGEALDDFMGRCQQGTRVALGFLEVQA